MSLDPLFRPGSVAVIGASAKELSIGNRIIKNLLDFGFRGRVHPVNPKGEDVRGIKSCASILDVEGEVDLAHIVIPSRFVLQAVEDCGKKGVKVAVINTAGFKEVGGDGAELERQLVESARKQGLRLFGPNCQGVINTDPGVRAYCNFTFTRPEPGSISIVAQSGGVGEVLNQRFSELGAGVRMYAANGNACDISIPEIIRYWGNDEATKVVVVHIENLPDPRDFMDAAMEVARKKPVLGMKTGRTTEGAKAAASHTGGLARADIAAELIFKKCGMVSFRDEEELCQAAIAFASQPVPRGRRVGMITNTGGPAIIATDELVEAGLEIPPLSESASSTLKGKLYPEASINNPVDVLATAQAEHFRAALDVLMGEERIDSILINFVTPFFVDTAPIARELAAASRLRRKPVICNLMTDRRQWKETIEALREGGVPFYSFPETAARALVAMTRYGEMGAREPETPEVFTDVDLEGALSIVERARSAGRSLLSAEDSNRLLEAYRIPVAGWRTVQNGIEAADAARELGSPVVVKVDAPDIVHKSDAGGVALNLQVGEVMPAVERMRAIFSAHKPRFLVQEQVPEGREVIVGAKAQDNLGHILMFGLGGVHVELLKDVAFGIAPVSRSEVEDMMSSVRSYPLLTGFRGEEGADVGKLVELMQRVSQLVTDVPKIREMDLNPIIASRDRARVVDARIIV